MQAPASPTLLLSFLPPNNFGGEQRILLANPKTSQIKTVAIALENLTELVGSSKAFWSSNSRTLIQKGWRKAFKVLLRDWTEQLQFTQKQLQKKANAYNEAIAGLFRNPSNWELVKRTTQLFYELKLEESVWLDRSVLLVRLTETESSLKSTKCFSKFTQSVEQVSALLGYPSATKALVNYLNAMDKVVTSFSSMTQEQRMWASQHLFYLRNIGKMKKEMLLAKPLARESAETFEKVLTQSLVDLEQQGKKIVESDYTKELLRQAADFHRTFANQRPQNTGDQATIDTYLQQLEGLIKQLQNLNQTYFFQARKFSKVLTQHIEILHKSQVELGEHLILPQQEKLNKRPPTTRQPPPGAHVEFMGELKAGAKERTRKKIADKDPLLKVFKEHLPKDLEHQFPFLVDLMNSFLYDVRKQEVKITIPEACNRFIAYLKARNERIEQLTPEDFLKRIPSKKSNTWDFKGFIPNLEQLKHQILSNQWKEFEERTITYAHFSPVDLEAVIEKMEIIFFSAPITELLVVEVFDVPSTKTPPLPEAQSIIIPKPTPPRTGLPPIPKTPLPPKPIPKKPNP